MSWLGRLIGLGGAASEAALPDTAVVVPDDLARLLTAAGLPLQDAAVAALRAHLAEAEAQRDGGRPFWVTKEGDAPDDDTIDRRLRDRLERRRAAEDPEAG